jgi:hypothetical protein
VRAAVRMGEAATRSWSRCCGMAAFGSRDRVGSNKALGVGYEGKRHGCNGLPNCLSGPAKRCGFCAAGLRHTHSPLPKAFRPRRQLQIISYSSVSYSLSTIFAGGISHRATRTTRSHLRPPPLAPPSEGLATLSASSFHQPLKSPLLP